jgi:eukaryotic-like serine/threonine-protein kinase
MNEPAVTTLESCPFCGAEHSEALLRCPSTDMALPLAGRLLAGKFRFVRELGRGGMGAVWRARNIHVDRQVALKLILPEVPKNPEIVARFQNEARVAARIGHPGICDILDFEVTPLGPVMVMELLRGENLAERIDRETRLPAYQAVRIVREALIALEAAHRAGIIHRDLKPENLFLHQPEVGPMVVKLMDFGISKFIDRAGAQTASGVIMGTAQYMAPEQVGGAANADARTDIWAIGAVLYRALTGNDAFAGDSFTSVLLAITSGSPAPIDVAAIHPRLVAVIMRCLTRSRDERYQSARELADALAPFADPDGPAPTRVEIGTLPTLRPSGDRSSATMRPRRRWPLVLAAFAAAALVAGGWWLATRVTPGDRPDPVVQAPSRVETPAPVADPPQPVAVDPPAPVAVDPPPVVVDPPPPTIVDVDDPAAPADPPASPTTPPDPLQLLVGGDHVTPAAPGKPGTQHAAKEYCTGLARIKFAGIDRWKLANPAEAKQFAKVAGIKSAGYWTTANHRGRGLIVWLPRGTDDSIKENKRFPRPLCVATRP